ncbi:hypothetical protein [Natrinema salaciae]|uniref:MJ0042 family finger-like domain-containing protein n=1 Tax=Natrinema salaciae TaxID=1186196 RepID=A0A1H9S157_9EURY|nr:hypothetical protein [Natrinema salaciae]SER78786.1 hypothetical protein SAMN04489841_4543 [Natrinema salaciae]
MDDTPCPACLSAPCAVIDRRITEHGLRITFECDRCEHVWDVVF